MVSCSRASTKRTSTRCSGPLEVAGKITDLRLQVPLHCLVNGLLVCDYIADFAWLENGVQHVGDAKSEGTRTAVYRLKKKLVFACLDVQIEEL
jgi:hypothetical protein